MARTKIPQSGIYCIRNTISGRVYIGSSNNIPGRWRGHKRLLRRDDHHSRILQASWSKHGEEAFEFSVIEEVTHFPDLVEREQFWIDELGAATRELGLNVCLVATSCLGVQRTQETKDKISQSKIGKKRPPGDAEHRAALMRGYIASEETRAKMRAIRSGRPQPSKRSLSFDDATEIRRLRSEERLPQGKLAEMFGVSRKSVREILAWNTYTAPDPVAKVAPEPPAIILPECVVAQMQSSPVLTETHRASLAAPLKGRFARKVFGQLSLSF